MSDFLKIFFVLCGLATAFVFGRNYGEKTITESKDFQKTQYSSVEGEKCQQELAGTKQKFQELLDSSDLKKADEVLAKIMTIFLADLSLHLSDDKQKEFAERDRSCASKPTTVATNTKQNPSDKGDKAAAAEEKAIGIDRKYKSAEWMLSNSNSDQEIKNRLKEVEIKNLDNFLKGAPKTDLNKAKVFFGEYRGTIFGQTKKIYGELYLNVGEGKNKKGQAAAEGQIKLFRRGEEVSSSGFNTDHFGYSQPGTVGTIVTLGQQKLVQFIPVQGNAANQIAGFLYERMPNGTTNTIGSFIIEKAY